LSDRLRQRKESAFQELLQVASPPLLAFVRSYGITADEAEDVIQALYVRIWNLGPRFTPVGSIEAYLFTAARNATLNVLRNAGINERYVRRYAEELEVDSSQSDSDREDAIASIRNALTFLTEHQRTAFELRYGQGMTIPEIAQVLGITPKGAEHLMTRVNKTLRQHVIGEK
jgi:RNA polymerase sigma-70 factor (ECF subfamily)